MDKPENLYAHISAEFNEELAEIRSHVLQMGRLARQQVDDALAAIAEPDRKRAEQVISREGQLDKLEMTIDAECVHVLARRQPAASDLRLLMAATKITSNLELVGDEADKIASMALQIPELDSPRMYYMEVRHLGNYVLWLLREALESFENMKVDLALEVVRRESQVDEEYERVVRQLITRMMEDPRTISRVLDITWSARALERVGYHARNISEHVIYFVHGKDVRHISPEEMERAIRERS